MARQRWAWAEISLPAIARNIHSVRGLLAANVAIMAIVKANAYGHGAVAVSKTALAHGATSLGVACVREAIQLREAGIQAPILILGGGFVEDAPAILEYRLTPSVFEKQFARALAYQAHRVGARVNVHLKVDTGLHRVGVMPDVATEFARFLESLEGLRLEGLYTHFAMADADPAYTRLQIERFDAVRSSISGAGVRIPVHHAANSAAIGWHAESHYTLVRVGLALYGLSPNTQRPFPTRLVPALTLKSRVMRVERMSMGSRIGYAGARPRSGSTVVATLAIEYADGVRRGPSTFPGVLIRGFRAPIVNPVCMDQMIVDVTDGPASIQAGDEAVLIGTQGDSTIGTDEVAEAIGTVSNEVLAGLSARLDRVYYDSDRSAI